MAAEVQKGAAPRGAPEACPAASPRRRPRRRGRLAAARLGRPRRRRLLGRLDAAAERQLVHLQRLI